MTKENAVKVIVVGVFMLVTAAFCPAYQKQVPKTGQESANLAALEIAQVPDPAPLALIIEPDDGISPVKNAINGAQKNVDLVMYELEDPNIEQELVNAQNRGVKVRVILQNVSGFGQQPNLPAYNFLQSQHVPVMWARSYFSLTHQKTLVVDNAQALIMTFNLTSQYYATSRDFALIDTNPQDVGAILAAFDSDWSGSQNPAGNGQDLVWSPGSADTLLALINSATASLDIYNEEMADPRIISALEQAVRRGVDVRVDMTYETSWKEAFNELVNDGVDVRTYPSTSKFYIHAKVILADDQRAFVGSENFSLSSLDLNRELGILIANPDIINSLENTFNNDWTGSRPYIPK